MHLKLVDASGRVLGDQPVTLEWSSLGKGMANAETVTFDLPGGWPTISEIWQRITRGEPRERRSEICGPLYLHLFEGDQPYWVCPLLIAQVRPGDTVRILPGNLKVALT